MKVLLLLSLLSVLVFASCQREVDFTDPPVVPEQIKDSTLLIKSITAFSDIAILQDSLVENYSYDSVNRKITITWNDPSGNDFPDGTKAELSYNNNWMLFHAVYIYPAGYIAQAGDYTVIDIVYDAEKVLQKTTVQRGDGSVETKIYSKTLLASGNYQLSWDETETGSPNDIVLRRAAFNAEGKNITSVLDHSFIAETTPAGIDVFNNVITTDSLFYDASGSLSKIIRNETDTLMHTHQSYVSYDLSARHTRGDQLYNQRQTILNGIANMPFFDPDSNADLFGLLSFSLENEDRQYLKYPIQTANIKWNMTDYHFIATSEFDSKNRLTKYTGFMVDTGITSWQYEINYYK